jgi:hypothetical protein
MRHSHIHITHLNHLLIKNNKNDHTQKIFDRKHIFFVFTRVFILSHISSHTHTHTHLLPLTHIYSLTPIVSHIKITPKNFHNGETKKNEALKKNIFHNVQKSPKLSQCSITNNCVRQANLQSKLTQPNTNIQEALFLT